jgi:hypothetical protein
MPKLSEGQFALGALTVFAVWIFVGLPFLHSTPAHAVSNNDPIASYTLALDVFTVFLVVAAIASAVIAFRQWRDTRILQRAYLGTIPDGLHDMTDGTTIAYVTFINSGNLPARNVRNEIKIGWSSDGEKRL